MVNGYANTPVYSVPLQSQSQSYLPLRRSWPKHQVLAGLSLLDLLAKGLSHGSQWQSA